MVGVVVVVAMTISNNIISIIITIIRTTATQGAALARWRDLPQTARYCSETSLGTEC